MEMAKELLAKILEQHEIRVTFPDLELNAMEIINMQSYQALQKIKAIIEDDNLDDFECVEQIVCVFESVGSNGGNRHDLG